MVSHVKIFVNLLEEGTHTFREIEAVDLGDGTYEVLPTTDYDSEDEVWEFVPGTKVIVQSVVTDEGQRVLLASRLAVSREEMELDFAENQRVEVVVRLRSSSSGETIRVTDAIDLGNGLFKLLPSEDYKPEDEVWEFSPGSWVRVMHERDERGREICVAFDQIREDRIHEDYARYVLGDRTFNGG